MGAQHPLGAEIWYSGNGVFWWVQFHLQIFKVTGLKFTGLVSPNAEGIAVDQIFVRFWISSSFPEISLFAAELQSRLKSGQILHVF